MAKVPHLATVLLSSLSDCSKYCNLCIIFLQSLPISPVMQESVDYAETSFQLKIKEALHKALGQANLKSTSEPC